MDPLDLPVPNPIDVRVGSYFSTPWKLAGITFLFAGLTIVLVNILIGVVLLLVGILIVTTHYRLAIDFDRHTYHDYVWILGIKNGDRGRFDQIEYIYITKNRVRQTLGSRATQSTFIREEFNGYLKLSEQVKLHLTSNESKQDVIENLEKIASKLKCKVIDYTMEQK